MFIDLIKAILFVGIPVSAFSFLMVYYAYFKGYLSTDIEFKDAFKKNNTAHSTLSKKNKKNLLFLHSKWVTFGGGFYGLIALLTFIVIELLQVTNFWLNVSSWQEVTALFSIQALIGMFVDSILNMIKAAIWFTYWPGILNTSNFISWVIVAYLGYRLGAKFAKDYLLLKRENQPNKSDSS